MDQLGQPRAVQPNDASSINNEDVRVRHAVETSDEESRREGNELLPIVWLLGASGVGKSTAGYAAVAELQTRGIPAAFVDADQLRLAAGLEGSQAGLIGDALPRLTQVYRDGGIEVLIVAGVAPDREYLDTALARVPRGLVTTVHLDADPDTIRARIRRRGWLVELADDAAAACAQIDPTWADKRVDTSDASPDEVAEHVARASLVHVAEASHPPDRGSLPPHRSVRLRRLIAVTGPGGVGVSTTGFHTFTDLARAGERIGYVDAQQLGLVGGTNRGASSSFGAKGAKAVIDTLAGKGADIVIVSGDPRAIAAIGALTDDGTPVTAFWLHANGAALTERITARSRGGGPPIQGDVRLGMSGAALHSAIAQSIEESRSRALVPLGARRIDTSCMTPAAAAGRIVALVRRDQRIAGNRGHGRQRPSADEPARRFGSLSR